MLERAILLSGPMFSGKDTIADHLVANHGYTKMALADTLKQLTASTFCFPVDWCYSREGKKQIVPMANGFTVGEVLQRFGTNVIRHINPDFWADKLLKQVCDLGIERVVIPDCRFLNEYVTFHRALNTAENHDGFAAALVVKDGRARRRAAQAGDNRDPNHESELGWMDIENWPHGLIYNFYNHGTKDVLFADLDALINDLHVGHVF
jgi:hypothetical protein